ncbi:hypothetical protein ACHAPJ_006708 [Fusarium lateritium]
MKYYIIILTRLYVVSVFNNIYITHSISLIRLYLIRVYLLNTVTDFNNFDIIDIVNVVFNSIGYNSIDYNSINYNRICYLGTNIDILQSIGEQYLHRPSRE